MAIRFRQAVLSPLVSLTAEVPGSAMIGVIGDDPAAVSALLRLAAGTSKAESGEVEASEPRRLIGITDAVNLATAGTLAMDHALAREGMLVRSRARVGLERLRRGGASILFASHETELLSDWCDEVWWLKGGALQARGNPAEVLEKYRRDAVREVRAWATSVSQPLDPSLRRGDGRARVIGVETLNASEQPSMVLASGETASVRIKVRFEAAVDQPVVGMLIRTRIGFEVFGTNTDLEGLKLGPVSAGDVLQILFSFPCNLCPGDYTLTVASHDADGIWHDWQEEAISFAVSDSRYTAGVANLRAKAEFSKL
jgi:lipopolysaccharide transport system ATP-binding protein